MLMIYGFPPFAAWQKPWASNLSSIFNRVKVTKPYVVYPASCLPIFSRGDRPVALTLLAGEVPKKKEMRSTVSALIERMSFRYEKGKDHETVSFVWSSR